MDHNFRFMHHQRPNTHNNFILAYCNANTCQALVNWFIRRWIGVKRSGYFCGATNIHIHYPLNIQIRVVNRSYSVTTRCAMTYQTAVVSALPSTDFWAHQIRQNEKSENSFLKPYKEGVLTPEFMLTSIPCAHSINGMICQRLTLESWCWLVFKAAICEKYCRDTKNKLFSPISTCFGPNLAQIDNQLISHIIASDETSFWAQTSCFRKFEEFPTATLLDKTNEIVFIWTQKCNVGIAKYSSNDW